jgi:outer membrane protein TolC
LKLKRVVILRLIACCFPIALLAQVPPPPKPTSNGPASVVRDLPKAEYSGSLPQGQATGTPVALSLRDAIQRGLQFNLGALTNRDLADAAKVDRRKALSNLLPEFYVGATQASQQFDLVAFGFQGAGFPSVVGPFGYQNVRAYLEQTVYDRPSRINLTSFEESRQAAEFTAEDARNLVVQAVSNAYLNVITEAARVDAIQAELNTAQALFDRAGDQKKAGTVAGIDVLRAEVQLTTEQQRLVAQRNRVEKAKLTLARAIGLAGGQTFNVTDTLPFTPLAVGLEQLLQQAYEHRNDFRAAQANIRAAQFAVDSAKAEHWPTVVVQGDYGDIGSTFANSHGTYSLLAGVRVPIYNGGKTQADVDQAEIALRTKRNALEDLRGRIEYEVRNAVLDL